MMRTNWQLSLTAGLTLLAGSVLAQSDDNSKAAQAFRKGNQPVPAVSDTTVVCEAEEFRTKGAGWQAKPFGSNYYAATFANSFLSRKGYLGAPDQCDKTEASIDVQVPKAGRYLALIRYEAAYRFETQFRLKVEQGGKTLLDKLYGSRDNLRIWAFRQMLKKEVGWDWGAGENLVWEGHDAFVELQAGQARLTLVADKQPTPAARRNIDLVMLTSDLKQVDERIKKENYLPLDGMLTQAGDVYLKLHNQGGAISLTVPNGTEHSPYWIHMRSWKPLTLAAKPAQSTDWVEVGSLLDTLSDGQWKLGADGKQLSFGLEFGVKNADGKIETIRKFDGLTGNVELAYDGDTRYTRRIRLVDEVLFDLVNYLKKQPVAGKAPKQTLIYGYTFAPKPANAKYTAALDELVRLMGATALGKDALEDLTDAGLSRGYIDVRGEPTDKLEAYCQKLQKAGRADKIAVVSLGDEIGLASPPAKDHDGFRAWLKSQKLSPADVDKTAAGDWNKILYNPDPKSAQSNPSLYYHSKIYAYRFGIKILKSRTDILRKYLPNAGIGANFSPHHSSMYLGETHHWISLFREQGMTMPWGEDYIWQVPVGTQQMNFIMLDMFRAGIKGLDKHKIHYYVMPHTPGNLPDRWRRQFYGDLAHGAKVLNLFEFRPVQAAYTENHCSDPAMYQEVRKSIHELGLFEDIIQNGKLLPAEAGLWFSEAADVWHDHKAPFDASIRTLYIALRHAQMPLDFVLDGDDLKTYKVIYLCDRHVSRAGSKALAAWVAEGGTLFASAGAGMLDETNQPNTILRDLLGIAQEELEESPEVIRFEKQDLPFAKPLATVKLELKDESTDKPVFGARSKVKPAAGAEVLASFQDKTPAVLVKKAGKGRAYFCAFLPGLSYFKPAMVLRPVDRGSTEDSSCHYMPTNFDETILQLLDPGKGPQRPVTCSSPRVETTVIRAQQGIVIPLINWHDAPIKNLTVRVRIPVPTKASLASGRPVRQTQADGETVFTLDLEAADALILR